MLLRQFDPRLSSGATSVLGTLGQALSSVCQMQRAEDYRSALQEEVIMLSLLAKPLFAALLCLQGIARGPFCHPLPASAFW